MASDFIPKIQWANTSFAGTTGIGSPIVTAISSTSTLNAGMVVTGSGIPASTTILTVDSSTQVTLSKNATASASPTLTFYNEFVFTYPPTKDDLEQETSVVKLMTSLSGVEQVQKQFIEYERDVTYRFLTVTDIESLKNFFDTWASAGKVFLYFVHNAVATTITYSMKDFHFKPKKILPKDSDFLYELVLKFRRAV